jgi:uncharacterized protein
MSSAVLILHTFLHLISMTSASRAEPSFECSRAVRPDERAICNNDDLAQRDQLGAQIFAMLAQKPDTASAGVAVSLRFIDVRRVCGAEVDCIRREQNALLAALVRIAAPDSRFAPAPLAPVVSPRAESFGRYSRALGALGAVLAILLCAALGRLIRIVALWRADRTHANANPAIDEVSQPPSETESSPEETFLPSAETPSAAFEWLARIASWRRYRANHSARGALP